MNMNYKKEFFPTPELLLEKVFEGVDWTRIESVLEPSCGRGDMALWIKKAAGKHFRDLEDIDCIELDPELRQIAKGNKLRVVHDDFLTYQTFKHYDLIAMNPPFSKGAEHLMKALDMQKNGGNIICILNAETIKNPFSHMRKFLVRRLEELGARIDFMEEGFVDAERPTTVEVAVIKVTIPEKIKDSSILGELRSRSYEEDDDFCSRDVAVNDLVGSIVKNYEMEVEAGIRLINEYKAMKPYLLDSLDKDNAYSQPILKLTVGQKSELSVNAFVRRVREKYWSRLFNDKRFTRNMTSNLLGKYRGLVHDLRDYDSDCGSVYCGNRNSLISIPTVMNFQKIFITIMAGKQTRPGSSTRRLSFLIQVPGTITVVLISLPGMRLSISYQILIMLSIIFLVRPCHQISIPLFMKRNALVRQKRSRLNTSQ